MAWVLWLAAPVVATAIAGCLLWWRGRPAKQATTRESIEGHRRYLATLAARAPGDQLAEPVTVVVDPPDQD